MNPLLLWYLCNHDKNDENEDEDTSLSSDLEFDWWTILTGLLLGGVIVVISWLFVKMIG